jgi:hypothetical protein
MRATKLLLGAAVLAASEILVGGASATTITFSGLADPNGAPFTTYMESGFTVTSTLGTWFQGQSFGNPIPSIFSGPFFGSPATDSVTVTEGGQRFTFSALDLAANNGNVNFTFTGTLLGAPVFNIVGTEPGLFSPFAFVTELSGVAATVIDQLVVTTNILGTSTNIDNIVVATVAAAPEPTTLGLLATGLALFGLLRRRSRDRSI